jgi:hypothetical protein
MTPRALIDYAINTGHFYNRHVRYARERASQSVWHLYVRATLLPHYRRETREPYEGMSEIEIGVVANELMFYYANHIKEMDA